ncbi:MAG: GIY-YIG nuclease family protein [Bacteroidota bacterium]|nr:GIY-YIG nuclease family protein [Bacteroidota bacterium]
MYFVYIIQSISSKRYYTGSTEDIENRLVEHNRGENKSTRYGVPWKIVHQEVFENRSEAIQKEKQIKSRGVSRYLQDIGKLAYG